MQLRPETIEVSIEELQVLVDRTRQELLDEEGHRKLKGAIATLGEMARLLAEKETTLGQLRDLLLKPPTTEKTRVVLERAGITTEQPNGGNQNSDAKAKPDKKKKGHGRNPARAFPGAQKIHVRHPTLKPGDRCPECQKGKVYPLQEPAWRVRIVGQAPVQATVYDLERMRCNLCQEVFTAPVPDGVGEEKYDQTAASMVAVLKYGNGVPFYRLDRLQENLGMPLPAATQWEMVAQLAGWITPVHEELIRQAAQGEVLHNDDTSVKILALRRAETDARTGVFTSGIVSTAAGQRIALFFTGGQHAGENLADVLKWRAADLPPPIQMCDALSRNAPKLTESLQTLLANCLAHGRRKFVEVAPSFLPQCRYVLEMLSEVYGYDEQAREQSLSPEERLRFHQLHSGPVMEQLHAWLHAQFEERNVEPNSGLGKAISYLLKHWERLTLFLRKAGAPLDNNLCERALKKAILHRKNSLFYKTEKGARVGDLFMSLIHTCELCGTNPFDYLTQLQTHAGELRQNPREWMPWNYHATLARSGVTDKAA